MKIQELDPSTNQPIPQAVTQFHERLTEQEKEVVTLDDLSSVFKEYEKRQGDTSIIWPSLVQKFGDKQKTDSALQASNVYAMTSQRFLNHISQQTPRNSERLPRFDKHLIAAMRFMNQDSLDHSFHVVTLKNILHYSFMLLDMGIIFRNDLFEEAPLKNWIHAVALLSMASVFLFEIKTEIKPQLFELGQLAEPKRNDKLSIKQYKKIIGNLHAELNGDTAPVFFADQRELLAKWSRLGMADNIVSFLPRFYFGGIILAPATVPLVMAAPMMTFDQRPTPITRVDNALIFGLAVYFYAFIFLMLSDDLSDFIDTFAYYEEDACYTRELHVSAAALGGGAASAMAILLFALGNFVKQALEQCDCSPQTVMNGIRHQYNHLRGVPADQEPLLSAQDRDLESGNSRPASQNSM